MDRLTRTLAGFGLAVMASVGGCKAPHDEVPPGKAYAPSARGNDAVGFSTTPPARAQGGFGPPPSLTANNLGAGGTYGAQMPSNDLTGSAPDNRFGAPGTSGAVAGSQRPSASLPNGPGAGPANPLSGLGQAPPLGAPAPPTGSPRPDTGYLNGFPNSPNPAGAMGSAGQPPSPL